MGRWRCHSSWDKRWGSNKTAPSNTRRTLFTWPKSHKFSRNQLWKMGTFPNQAGEQERRGSKDTSPQDGAQSWSYGQRGNPGFYGTRLKTHLKEGSSSCQTPKLLYFISSHTCWIGMGLDQLYLVTRTLNFLLELEFTLLGMFLHLSRSFLPQLTLISHFWCFDKHLHCFLHGFGQQFYLLHFSSKAQEFQCAPKSATGKIP